MMPQSAAAAAANRLATQKSKTRPSGEASSELRLFCSLVRPPSARVLARERERESDRKLAAARRRIEELKLGARRLLLVDARRIGPKLLRARAPRLSGSDLMARLCAAAGAFAAHRSLSALHWQFIWPLRATRVDPKPSRVGPSQGQTSVGMSARLGRLMRAIDVMQRRRRRHLHAPAKIGTRARAGPSRAGESGRRVATCKPASSAAAAERGGAREG